MYITLATKSNTNTRYSFASVTQTEYPDLLDIQLKSFQEFFQIDTDAEKRKDEGLYKVFSENFPITDARNSFVLEFLDYYIDGPRYTMEECIMQNYPKIIPKKILKL